MKIGLALGGGGARGSYQVGLLKALNEAGIIKQINHVSGTSIGAINTLMVMADLPYERMISIWEKLDNKDIYGQGFDRFRIDRLGLYSLHELYEKLSKEISISEIRNSRMQGYATAAKIKKQTLIDQILLHRMEKEVFHLNDCNEPYKAVLASASIPVLFGSTEIDHTSYVDGGAIDNCPIQPLVEAGCQVVFAAPIDGRLKIKHIKKYPILLINMETNFLFKMIPYDILDFKPDCVHKNANYGYHLGKLIIEKIKQLSLYDGSDFFFDQTEFKEVCITKEEEQHLKIQYLKEHKID